MKILQKNRGISTTGWIVLVLGLLLLLIIVIPAINQGSLSEALNVGTATNTETDDETGNDLFDINGENEEESGSVTLGDIYDNPDNYIGQTVTVDAEINEILGNQAMLLDEPGIIGQDFLVVTRNTIPQINDPNATEDELIFSVDDRVQVTGTIMEYNLQNIETEIGTTLDTTTFGDIDPEIVMIADSIQLMEE